MNFVRSLTLRQLQIFMVAARHASFARAAKELHLSQPAVSMQIKQTEDTVGLPLFERGGRRLTLTVAGEKLSRHALRILDQIKDAEEELQSLKDTGRGVISLGIVNTAKYFVPKLLARYTRQYPSSQVQLSVDNRETLVKLLQDNAIDLAIMGRPPQELDALTEPLAYHPHVIVAPPDHPLRHARRLDLHDLRQEIFLLREPGSDTRLVAGQMFKDRLFTPAKMVTLRGNETIKQAVMAGMGVSLLSLHTLLLELRTQEIALLDVAGTPITRVWYLTTMRAKQLSPACQTFQQFMLENTGPYLEQDYAGFIPGREDSR